VRACASPRVDASYTKISPPACLPCSGSTKRGRRSNRRRRESWMITNFTVLSTLWLLFRAIHLLWQNSSSGSRESQKRILAFRSPPTLKPMPVACIRAIWLENSALREAAFGSPTDAKQEAEQGLKLYPASQSVQVGATLAFAMANDATRTESLARDLNKRFPLDTQMRSLWLPAIHAQLALNRNNAAEGIGDLQAAASSIELGSVSFGNGCLYSVYVRAEAFLLAGQGKEAAAEFQKILDHNGIVWNCWTVALAHLGLARANALQARTSQGRDADAARVRAVAAYNEFLTLWKNADRDIPILKQAQAEYAKLQ